MNTHSNASPTRIRIKFCGLTRIEDVLIAHELGVDAIGFVFANGSPRAVSLAQAERLAGASGALQTRVALFRNAPASFVREVLSSIPIEVLQFHGNEDAAYCQQFDRPYWKAIGMHDGLAHARAQLHAHARASAYVCDAHANGGAGGSGQGFDWTQWPREQQSRLILAGGLTPENVRQAIEQTRCHAVDVSSGIESKPGVKDPARMRQFVQAVRGVP